MEFRLLGPLVVIVRDRPLTFGGPREEKVLAALLADVNHVIPVPRLIDVVWDDDPPATAAKQVRNAVSRLRASLAPATATLATEPAGYRLISDPDQVDTLRFAAIVADAATAAATGDVDWAADRLRAALALWRGPALAGLSGRVIDSIAAEWNERRAVTQETLFDHELALGRHRDVLGELTGLAAAHPTRERLVGQLMSALCRCGRQSDALAAYRRTRDVLAAELGLSPGAGLRELRQSILVGDPRLDQRDPDPSIPVPRHLPPLPRHFTGREAELAELDRLLDSGDRGPVVISSIEGSAGVGKTTLAERWAHRVTDRFPDGQLYIDLRGYDATPPVRTIEALTRFLRALGVPGERTPVDPDEAAGLYRSLVSERRMLVLLDNASATEQVLPLLPGGPGCMALITSRDRLSGLVARHGAHRITLDVLSLDESVALLRAAIGAVRTEGQTDELRALARLCACLPLALRIAAAHLDEHRQRTVADQVTALTGDGRMDVLRIADDPGMAVRVAFDLSYATLPTSTRRLFRLLGLTSGDAGLPAIAALAGRSPTDTRADLTRLARAHLVDERTRDRFGCHDLLRLYARDRATAEDPADERNRALRRMFSWYLRTAFEARSAVAPHLPLLLPQLAGDPADDTALPDRFPDHDAAMTWFRVEQTTLAMATAQAAELGFHDIAAQLPIALYPFYDAGKHWSTWITTHQVGIASARCTGDRTTEGKLWCNLGNAYQDMYRPAEAVDCYEKALPLFQTVGYRQGEAKVRGNLCNVYHHQGRYAEAEASGLESVRIFRALDDAHGECLALANLAGVHAEYGELAAATACLADALPMARSIDDGYATGIALGNLGDVHRRAGQPTQAVAELAEALDLHRALSDEYQQGLILHRLGQAHTDAGDSERATDCFEQALAIRSQLNDEHGITETATALRLLRNG